MYGIGCFIRNKWNTISIILTSTRSQYIMCKSWNKIMRKNWSDWVVKYLLQNIGFAETQLSVNKGFNFYMCACFVVCDFVSCHCVEHPFSLVVYDKLYTTQNNVWKTSIYEGSLFVCFVCTYEIHWTMMLQIAFFVSLESSQGGGVHWLGFMVFGLIV